MDLSVRIHNEDDEMLWAEIPELPGCFASGDSRPELMEAIQEAVSLYLSSPESGTVALKMESANLRVVQPL